MSRYLDEAIEHPQWDRFSAFADKNPHIFEALVRATRRSKEMGNQKTAINRLVQDLRWDSDMSEVESDEGVRLPNAFAPLYARMIAHFYPELADMFNYNKVAS